MLSKLPSLSRTEKILGLALLTVTGINCSDRVKRYPSYLYETFRIYKNNYEHRQKFPTFYQNNPNFECSDRNKLKGNILLINYGKLFGAPYFGNKDKEGVDSKDYNFVTISDLEVLKSDYTIENLWKVENYLGVLRSFPREAFKYIVVFTLNEEQLKVTETSNFGRELSILLQDKGELLLYDNHQGERIKIIDQLEKEGKDTTNRLDLIPIENYPKISEFVLDGTALLLHQAEEFYYDNCESFLNGEERTELYPVSALVRYLKSPEVQE